MINLYGVFFSLFIAIFLISRSFTPAYALIFGSFVGAMIGGLNPMESINSGEKIQTTFQRIFANLQI